MLWMIQCERAFPQQDLHRDQVCSSKGHMGVVYSSLGRDGEGRVGYRFNSSNSEPHQSCPHRSSVHNISTTVTNIIGNIQRCNPKCRDVVSETWPWSGSKIDSPEHELIRAGQGKYDGKYDIWWSLENRDGKTQLVIWIYICIRILKETVMSDMNIMGVS